jgi:hypothetical protein
VSPAGTLAEQQIAVRWGPGKSWNLAAVASAALVVVAPAELDLRTRNSVHGPEQLAPGPALAPAAALVVGPVAVEPATGPGLAPEPAFGLEGALALAPAVPVLGLGSAAEHANCLNGNDGASSIASAGDAAAVVAAAVAAFESAPAAVPARMRAMARPEGDPGN